ncbi:putative iron-regulated protein [Dongia mobilis]|uniref:Putative iron-regulated protein n=1 Tax=Dongia mobilis TaxID=578943 RepID=A0A4R6WRI9_9PROT|nr:imelysin family protein [Dongia mobilis]TDQ81407.1 putative iron-regulated protein [Dongia mobilis]
MRQMILAGAAAAALVTANGPAMAATEAEILQNYADIAEAMYGDAITQAAALRAAVAQLVAQPTDANLEAARTAWRAARPHYQQTEVYRFGNPEVDELEGLVNAWPLDEGLIDYVDASYGEGSDSNPYYTLNVIANHELQIGAEKVDAADITKELLQSLQEVGDNEANVAIGYHAIEFLLWGQDLNGTGPGAGKRPASDFDPAACTNGNCDRRAAYLVAATDLLVDDLQQLQDVWKADGTARKRLQADARAGIGAILTGIGSLSYGELAGERTKLGLMLHDPEEEHDCFSDNTHNSHYYDQAGMVAVYNGSYRKLDGGTVSGASVKELIAAKDIAVDARITAAMEATTGAMTVLKETADGGEMAYDQMLGEGNAKGNAILEEVVATLVAQARAVEAGVAALDLTIAVEGSDSLDNPSAVGQ